MEFRRESTAVTSDDGFFISNFAGTTPEQSQNAFEAVNFIYPFLLVLGSFGFMFGTGGAALISKVFGEGDSKKANSIFSLVVYFSVLKFHYKTERLEVLVQR